MFQSLNMLYARKSSLCRTCHSKITMQILESILCQWICKDVCKLIFKPAKFQTNFFVVHQLSYEMKPCVDVLSSLVKHMIL